MRWTRHVVPMTLVLTLTAAALRTATAQDPVADEEAFDSDAVREIAERAEVLSVDERIALIRRLRRSLDRSLLTPPTADWEGFESLRGRSDAGLARIVERGLLDNVVTPRGGGAYWSFTRRSNSYDEHPQLELQKGRFSTGFYGGNCGLVVRLAGTRLADVTESMLEADLVAGPADVRAKSRSRREPPAAEVGGVYAVRAVLFDEVDVLAVFQVVSIDSYGATIAWRIVRRYPAPTRER